MLAAVLLAVLVAAAGAAQEEREPPEVEVEASPIEGYVEPLEAWRETTVEVRVGCERPEPARTTTEVELSTGKVPKGASVSLNRTALSWMSEPGDCPDDGFPFRANVTASVATEPRAQGFVEQTIPLEATVTKSDEVPSQEPRTYEVDQAPLSFTPGYHHEHTLEVPEPQQVDPDGVATFQLTVESHANAEARYTVHADEVPVGVEVSVESEPLVLDPGEEERVEVRVERVDADAASGRSILVFNATGQPTHPDGGPGGSETIAVPVELEPSGEDTLQSRVPSLAGPLVAIGLALTAVGASRSVGRRR